MPLIIERNDITKMKVDAVVNAANRSLLGGGGVDGAIHAAAGKGLLAECVKLGGCKTGDAKITGAHKMICKYIIHTVGPVWHGGGKDEKELLKSCYRKSLALAEQYRCESVAFPLISTGAYGYPKEEALKIAVSEITDFLASHDMLVYIVVFDGNSFKISEKLFSEVAAFIDDNYVDSNTYLRSEEAMPYACREPYESVSLPEKDYNYALQRTRRSQKPKAVPPTIKSDKAISLDDMIKNIDESFSQMLLRKIDEKGITDAECYKKANIDRKLFSKIRSDINYHPKKTTAIAFAVALELNMEETKDMLMKAGFALSHSNKFDIIIEYFITNGNYNIFEINEALFAFDQSLLGS